MNPSHGGTLKREDTGNWVRRLGPATVTGARRHDTGKVGSSIASIPRSSPTVLFLSNGHGEDTVGAAIATRLRQRRPDCRLLAAPIVGEGDPYRDAGIPIVVRTQTLPSGGFIYTSRRAMWRDVTHGVVRLMIDKIRALRATARDVDLVVGVGDQVILYLEDWVLRRPLAFVGVAYSAYYQAGSRPAYSSHLCRILRRHAIAVYPRDALTGEQLLRQGVHKTRYVGNPMMDCFRITGDDLGFAPEQHVIGLLPGSREEAYGNLSLILRGVDRLEALEEKNARGAGGGPRPIGYAVALAGSLKTDRIAAATATEGWQLQPGETTDPGPGVVAELVSSRGTRVKLVRGRFGDVIHRATIVIGLAGTANEQAAGLGKPIITFPGGGHQMTPRFVRSQQRLLGDAVHVVEPEPDVIARAVQSLLADPARRDRMGAAGRARMGEPGAVDRIVSDIVTFLR